MADGGLLVLDGQSSLGGGEEGHRLNKSRPIHADHAHLRNDCQLAHHLGVRSQDLGLHGPRLILGVLEWVSTVHITGMIHRRYSTANFKFCSFYYYLVRVSIKDKKSIRNRQYERGRAI